MYSYGGLLGKDPRYPVKILANLNARSFGDFASSLFFVNSLADHFDYRTVTVLYRDDMDFKSQLVRLTSANLEYKLKSNQELPSFEIINCSTPMISNPGLADWFRTGLNEPHFVISETMAGAPNLCMLERYAYLTFPDELAKACEAQLLELGLSNDRWFCTMHCREPGYADKPDKVNFRDCDPAIFLRGANHIIENFGGQVVRLGHPGMTPMPARKGFIDLSVYPESALLQTFAISRSRFLVAGPSGPSALAVALNVPLALFDLVDFGTLKYEDIVRTIDVVSPQGEVINQKRYFEMGLTKLEVMRLVKQEGYRARKNSSETMIALVDRIVETTPSVDAWRKPTPLSAGPRPNRFTWPTDGAPKCSFL